MSAMDWLKLGLVLYIVCFMVVLVSMHHRNFMSRIRTGRTRRTVGILALVLAPLSLVVGILWLLWRVVCAFGHEIEVYAGFGEEAADRR